MSNIVNAMTVDVEEYFQVSAFEKYIERDRWDSMESRVESSIDLILSIFDECNVKATFFTLGWIAERHPGMIKKIAEKGHEIASHGYSHKRLVNIDKEEFKEETIKTTQILESICKRKITGYRAPSYSITKDNLWVHEILAENGFLYSSSIYPIKHDLYGMPGTPRFSYKVASDRLLEIPISTIEILNQTIP